MGDHVMFLVALCLTASLSVPVALEPQKETGSEGECSVTITTDNGVNQMKLSESLIRQHLQPFLDSFTSIGSDIPSKFDATKVQRNVAQAVRNGMACLDPRVDEIIPTVEGGDIGMFILAMQSVEDLRRVPLKLLELETALALYITSMKEQFIVCTSDVALKRLCDVTGVCLTFDSIFHPPNTAEKLEELLTEPVHIGDDVLRYMVSFPDRFSSIRSDLPAQVMKAFFRLMWGKSSVPLSVTQQKEIVSKMRVLGLEGMKLEEGLIELVSSTHCHQPNSTTTDPLMVISPALDQSHSLRVRYPQLIREAIHQISEFVVTSRLVNQNHLENHAEDESGDVIRCITGETNESEANKLCFFPFEYQGELRYDCVRSDPAGHPSGWCATEFDWVTTESWGQCHEPGFACIHQDSATSETLIRLIELKMQKLSTIVFTEVLRQFQIDSSGSDSKGYGRSTVRLSPNCCPAVTHHFTKQNVQYQLTAPSKPRPIAFVCAPQSISVVPVTRLPIAHYSIDSVMPSQIREILGIDQMRPILFSNTSIERMMPIDGRQPEYIMGTPGASVGEFAAGLAAMEALSDTIQQSEVTSALVRWLNTMSTSQFVYAVDTNSLVATFASVAQANTRRALTVLREMEEEERDQYLMKLILDPPEEMKSQLIQALTVPILFGDSYLKFACTTDPNVQDPVLEANMKRLKRLIPMTIEAFFTIMWSKVPDSDRLNIENFHLTNAKARLDLTVMRGTHQEKGFVTVIQESERCKQTMAPLFPPLSLLHDHRTSLWVYHEDGARASRRELASYLSKSFAVDTISPPVVAGRVTDIVSGVMDLFQKTRQAQYPSYRVVFSEMCCPPPAAE